MTGRELGRGHGARLNFHQATAAVEVHAVLLLRAAGGAGDGAGGVSSGGG